MESITLYKMLYTQQRGLIIMLPVQVIMFPKSMTRHPLVTSTNTCVSHMMDKHKARCKILMPNIFGSTHGTTFVVHNCSDTQNSLLIRFLGTERLGLPPAVSRASAVPASYHNRMGVAQPEEVLDSSLQPDVINE
ncbi:hypothetical protein BDR04DRAFT_133495 [Suillus decipiens]|nr:hypothetical protein BDR04DRAFT_133495 [Suillus decipiens]